MAKTSKNASKSPKRRDFLHISAATMAGTGALAAAWPFIDSLNPSLDTLALSSLELDLSSIMKGERVTVKWRGKPIFISHRTEAEITTARSEDLAALPDPQNDSDRVQIDEWLVVIGICTHLGCVPLGQQARDDRGNWNGWFCPCHGSHYDVSGRIRKGPAPRNLDIPPYSISKTTLLLIIGRQ